MKKIIAIIDDPVLRAGIGPVLVALPGTAGVTFRSRMEAVESDAPAIIILAVKDRAADRVFAEGLRGAGHDLVLIAPPGSAQDWRDMLPAADIFTPPLRLGALADRVQAHRLGLAAAIPIGRFTLDAAAGVLRGGEGENIHLTEKERDILVLLHLASGRTVERRKILDAVWGYADGVETHTLETHIYRLRRKIESDPAAPEIIITEEAGYRLAV